VFPLTLNLTTVNLTVDVLTEHASPHFLLVTMLCAQQKHNKPSMCHAAAAASATTKVSFCCICWIAWLMTVVQSGLARNMGSRPIRPGELLPSPIHLSHQDEDHRQGHLQRQLQSAASATVDAGQNITALVLLVQFPEDVNATLPSRDYFEALCHGDMAAYLRQQSYGRYQVQHCDVRDWRMAPYAASVYARGVANLRGPTAAAEVFRPVLEQWWQWDSGYNWNETSNKHDNTIRDWTIYDANRDGILDAVLVWHSGYGAEYTDDDNECGVPPYYNRIHSQGHAHDNSTATSINIVSPLSSTDDATSIRLSGYAMASAWDGLCTTRPAKMGVMTHEWLHILGARDVYGDVRGEEPQRRDGGKITLGGLASYDVLSRPLGPTNTGIPASMSAYSKHAVGWLNYTEITSNDLYWLESSNRVPQAAVLRAGFTAPFEYLLLEFRFAVDYDANLFGGGLLIYHVDDGPRFKPDNSTTVFAKHHHRIAVLQADGLYGIERGNNFGDAGDFWQPGMVLRPSIGNETAVPPPPNTDSYNNGPTGIIITVLSMDDSQVSFRVEGIANDTSTNHSGPASSVTLPWSVPTSSPVAAPIEPSPSPPNTSPMAWTNEPSIDKGNSTMKPSAMWSDFPSRLPSASPKAAANRKPEPSPSPKVVAREFILPLSDSSLAVGTHTIGVSLALYLSLTLSWWLHLVDL
jgi:M6 family metalloprotease-like protein